MRNLGVAFLDFFMLLLVYVLLLWIFSMMLISLKEESTPTPKPRAAYIVTYTWSVDADSDVDGWAERNRDGNLVFFRRREVGPFILHNDNTGAHYGMVDGQPLGEARETLTIEENVNGFYELSLFGYSIRDRSNEIEVTIEMEQVAPYKLLFSRKEKVNHAVETPICSFEVKDGEIDRDSFEFDKDVLRRIVKGAKRSW